MGNGIDKEFRKIMREAKPIHGIWYKFCKHFSRWYHDEDGNFSSLEMNGYEAVKRVIRYAKKNPEIRILRCDDDIFCGARIVLIPHPTMGITAIIITQATSHRGELFFYPHDMDMIVDEIKKMKSEFNLKQEGL